MLKIFPDLTYSTQGEWRYINQRIECHHVNNDQLSDTIPH